MPELPELVAFQKFVENNCLYKKISKVKVEDHKLLKGISSQGFGRKVKDKEFVSAERYGKYLFLKISDNGYLMLHFGLTGSLNLFKENKNKPLYGKIFIHFEDQEVFVYESRRKLGYVKYVGDKNEYLLSKKLGADALSVSREQFINLTKFHKGVIKPLLMNQKVIAGIGNEYSDEILYQARIHPLSKIENLNLNNLFDVMQDVLNKAVKFNLEGKPLPDSWLINKRSNNAGCPGCGGKIKKEEIAGRSSYFCPACQPVY